MVSNFHRLEPSTEFMGEIFVVIPTLNYTLMHVLFNSCTQFHGLHFRGL